MVYQDLLQHKDNKSSVPSASIEKYFGGRTIAIATKHQKEKVLQPLLEQHLGVTPIVAMIDTDQFGTFTGEINRTESAFATARQKCIAAHEMTGETLVIASEGSFGAHPIIGFVPADEELLLLKDFSNNAEYRAKVISTQTNFSAAQHFEWEQVLFFASQVHFPSHGLIVKKEKDNTSEVFKDITEWAKLKECFYYFKEKFGQAYIETDMRAMHNPTRMKVIEDAAQKLLSVITTTCPICEGPGFEVTEVIRGLPCNFCNEPTQTAKAYVHRCQFCNHSETRSIPNGKLKEDPMFCDICNP